MDLEYINFLGKGRVGEKKKGCLRWIFAVFGYSKYVNNEKFIHLYKLYRMYKQCI